MSYTAIVEGDLATPALLNAIFDQLDIEAAAASFTAAVTIAGILSVDDTTDTTSTITGSIHTDGGIGIAKALWVGTTSRLVGAVTMDAILSVDDATDSTSGTTGSIHTDGGLGVAKALFVGTNVTADAYLASADDSGALGASGTAFADLFLASGAVINFNAANVTLTHSNNALTVGGGNFTVGANTVTAGSILAVSNDSGALGASGTAWADLFLASGSVINWVAGDVTLTHAAGKLTWGGDGTVEIDFNNHEMTNVDINSGAIDGTTVGAASITTGAFTTVDGTVSGVVTTLDNTASAGLNGMLAAKRGGSVAYYIGFDASDNFALLNIAADAANLTVTDIGDTTIRGDLAVTGTGPHAIGGATLDYIRTYLRGNFTSGGASDDASQLWVDGILTGAAGDTSELSGTRLGSSVVTQTATENIAVITQLHVTEPFITDNLTGDITIASTIYVKDAPTEGETNAAIYVGAGDISTDGGTYTMLETTTPTARTNYGKLYTKSDNALYFQDGAGVEHTVTIS